MERWYCLYSKPRKEQKLAEVLEARGIEAYVPTMEDRQGREVAFFTRYIFARFDLNAIGESSIRWTPGLTHIVRFGGKPAAVPDEVVSYIRERIAEIQDEGLPARFNEGDRVRIKEGPMRDLEGVFQGSLSGRERARILVEVLGALRAVEIDAEQLEKVGG